MIGPRGTETESVIGSRGRKKTTDVLRRSAEARSLEKLGANTTRSRAARVTGRRKTGRREVRNKKCETKVPIILGELEPPKRGINSRPEKAARCRLSFCPIDQTIVWYIERRAVKHGCTAWPRKSSEGRSVRCSFAARGGGGSC